MSMSMSEYMNYKKGLRRNVTPMLGGRKKARLLMWHTVSSLSCELIEVVC
jgi:hypothetical protein